MTIQISYPYAAPTQIWPGVIFGRVSDPDYVTGTSVIAGHELEYRGRSLLLLEPPLVEPSVYDPGLWQLYDRVWSFVQADGASLFRMTVPPLWPELGELCEVPWEERLPAVVAVMGNKYSERLLALDYLYERCLDAKVGLDAYGRPGFWDRPYYRGEIRDKRKLLQNYRWCYCPENCFYPHYLTEKLPEALLAGCLPIVDSPDDYLETYDNVFPWPYVQAVNTFHRCTADDHRALLREMKDLSSYMRHAMHVGRMLETICSDR